MLPTFFQDQLEFRNWLAKNHQHKTELLVGFYKVKTNKPSMTWSQSVDQALCFGWIDGIRKKIDEESYSIRFTPRKKDSIWSPINIAKIDALSKAGLMTDAGLKAFSFRDEIQSKVYYPDKETIALDATFERQFKKHKSAWLFFNQQAPSYKKVIIHWIMSAKQEKTRLSRLDKAIAESEQRRRVK